MQDDEDQLAAEAISDMIAISMARVLEEKPPRDFLYVWEEKSLAWLIRFRERNPNGLINAWTADFAVMNRDTILTGEGALDFDLRAFNERKRQDGNPAVSGVPAA